MFEEDRVCLPFVCIRPPRPPSHDHNCPFLSVPAAWYFSQEEYCLWLKNQVGISGRHGKPERHAVWAYLVAAADPAKPPSEEEHHDLGVPAALDTILTAEAYCLAVSRRCHAGHFDDDGEYDDYDVGH